MAGHEWDDWFEREEFIGQISDIRVQNLQVEREIVQKRTFTRWMNLHLEKVSPPMEVKDLFRDIQDGQILMALLEELSGCKLLHGFKKSSHRIFRLNNIAKVLAFLEERNVKLVSIDAADVADGNASIILGLIWNIILFFQIKELTGNIRSQFPSSSSLSCIPTSADMDTSQSSTPSDRRRTSAAMRGHGKAIKTLLQWVQRRTRKYGVAVQDFGRSWTSGLAFLAIIKSIDPSLVDMRKALLRTARQNLEDAFRTAHYSLGIPRLLEPEDVTINPPDEQSIMTYVSQFLEHFPGIEEAQDVTRVAERSVSVGRLGSRSGDSEPAWNGIDRGRQPERPCVVRRDWVQPPPKIFISSSVGEAPDDCPWAESTPSPGDGRKVFVIRTSNSPQPSYVNPVGAPSAAEPAIGDSAIGSPDSWAESEAASLDRFVESRSDGSLCDSGMAWDANAAPATPEDAALDDGLLTSVTGKPHDERSLPELFIDEGVYSLSSVDSTLERAKDRSDEQEMTSRYILDLNENGADQKRTPNKTEDSERRDPSTGQSSGAKILPSLELSHTPRQSDPEGTSQSQHSPDQVTPKPFEQTEERQRSEERDNDNSGHANVAMEPSRDSQEVTLEKMSARELSDNLGQSHGSGEVEIVSVTMQRTSALSEREERLKQALDERQDELTERPGTHGTILQDVPNGHIETQEDTATANVIGQTDTRPSVDMGQIQPSPERPSEPGPDQEQNYPSRRTESETPALAEPVNPQIFVLIDPPEEDERTRSPGRERNAGDEAPSQGGSSGGQMVEVTVEKLIADPGHSSPPEEPVSSPPEEPVREPLEPMDLFYPNREEAMLDRPEREAQTLSSSFSVSALQPAPQSDQPTPQSALETTPQPTPQSAPQSALEPTPQPTPQPALKPDQSAPQPAPQPALQSAPQSAPQPTPQPAPQPDQSAPQPAPQPAPQTALQPAPQPALASDTRPDTDAGCLELTHLEWMTGSRSGGQSADVKLGGDSERREDRTQREQDRRAVPGESGPGGRGALEEKQIETSLSVEHSDLNKTEEEKREAARENMASMRSAGDSDGAGRGSQLSAGLRHRKLSHSDELKDDRKETTPSPTHSTYSETSRAEVKRPASEAECFLTVSELYCLLALWLLLYCLLVLPQMDFSDLPGLFLNLGD